MKIDPIGHGGAGQIPLSSEQTGGGDEEGFSSEKELIDSLRNKASLGDKNAKLILARLYVKTWQGRKEQPRMLKEEFEGEKDVLSGKEIGLIERLNQDFRKREQMRRGQKDD